MAAMADVPRPVPIPAQLHQGRTCGFFFGFCFFALNAFSRGGGPEAAGAADAPAFASAEGVAPGVSTGEAVGSAGGAAGTAEGAVSGAAAGSAVGWGACRHTSDARITGSAN